MLEPEVLLRYIRIFSELTNQLKYATQKRVLLEVTLIKLCRPQMESTKDSLLDRIRALEKQVEEGAFAAPTQEKVVYVSGEAPQPKPKPELPKAIPEEVKQVAANFRGIISETSGMLRTYLNKARLSVDEQNRLVIVLPDEMGAGVVGTEEHKREIQELIEQKIGKAVEMDVRHVEEGRHFEDSFADIEQMIHMDITIEDE